MQEILTLYISGGFIATLYFILFVRAPVMEEFLPIMFRRELNMPKQHKFPYTIVGYLALAVIYPFFIYHSLINYASNMNESITDDLIAAYREALWKDIEDENNL